jgi:protein SDA1
MKFLAEYLMELLTNYINILHPYNRRKAVSGIIILRSKNVLFPVSTLQFLIGLLGVEDKELRKTIYTFVLNDLQRINRHRRNNTINRQLQSWIHDYIKKNSDRVARKMINLSIELYKKNVW